MNKPVDENFRSEIKSLALPVGIKFRLAMRDFLKLKAFFELSSIVGMDTCIKNISKILNVYELLQNKNHDSLYIFRA